MANKLMLDYIDVAARIVEFRTRFPNGSLQPNDRAKPYTIEVIDGQTYIVVVAAAYRTADDTLPGIGMAYEVFPGKTNYTRGSELQNAETSAWGRAIVAALAADTKTGVASAQEVRNRREEQDNPPDDAATRIVEDREFLLARIRAAVGGDIATMKQIARTWAERHGGVAMRDTTDIAGLARLTAELQETGGDIVDQAVTGELGHGDEMRADMVEAADR